MEKTIKMSLETAKELYKNYEGSLRLLLLENFTEAELEGKKGFTWEDSYSNNGYYILNNSQVQYSENNLSCGANKNVFKREKQALSALAFAQLSHIVAKYNEKPWKINENGLKAPRLWFITDELLIISSHSNYHGLGFGTREDAELSLEVNRQLWEQYWMI